MSLERDLLTFELAILGLAQRMELYLVKENSEQGSVLNKLEELITNKKRDGKDLSNDETYYLAFWHLMVHFNEYFFLYEGMNQSIGNEARNLLSTKKDLF